MNFHTAELFICPPYHQKIVCGEDPVIFLIIILGGIRGRGRVREGGRDRTSGTDTEKIGRGRRGRKGERESEGERKRKRKKGRERFFTRSFMVMYGSSSLEA